MNSKNIDKSSGWKNWIIKKLLSDEATKEEILNFIAVDEEENNNQFESFDDNNEKNLIKNILELNKKSVEDIMVPRGEIISVSKNQLYEDILKVIKKEGHSRMPVFENNLDNVLGFFHIKDFINLSQKNFNLSNILRDVLYVAPKSPILDLLKRMRTSSIHMGLVVDGFGGVDGLITIEDLVEEIVGEIEDEHDAEDQDELIISSNNNYLHVDASYKVEDLEKFFNISLNYDNQEEVDTVGGLVFAEINRIPKNNEIFDINNLLKIKIIKATERKIISVEIQRLKN
tara:strand:+ start:9119 stop:9976 length:858 start_codon:yes stop_codon:yes gene_type:complete